MPFPVRTILVAAILAAASPAAHADDAGDVRGVISAQLQAFKAGDSAGAYRFAAPSIQAMFPSPEIFMSMVRSGYAVVADPHDVTFGPMQAEGGGFRQDVNMTDANGRSFVATYTLERQPDGSLKITSCAIRRGDDVSA